MDEQDFVDAMETAIILKRSLNAKIQGDCEELFQKMPIILNESMKFWSKLNNLLEVKESRIHDQGVFAKVNLEANQVVTIYPCNGIIRDGCLQSLEEINPHHLCFVHNYKIKLADKKTFIFGNPDYQFDGRLGHLINDSCPNIEQLRYLDKDNISNCIEYLSNGLKCNNCVFVLHQDYVYVKTLQPIAKGEELISSYGFEFWCLNKDTSEIHQLMKEYLTSLTEVEQMDIIHMMKQHCHWALKPSKKWIDETLPHLLLTSTSHFIQMQSNL